MNVTLRGKALQIVDYMVTKGYANTKSEAIRMAILNFGKAEEILVNDKLDRIDKAISEGKHKVLSYEEALGVHAKYIKHRR